MDRMVPKCPISGFRFASFGSWAKVKHAGETNVSLYYWAPLDGGPRPVFVTRVFKNGKLRVTGGEVTFTADDKHLDRFYRLERVPS